MQFEREEKPPWSVVPTRVKEAVAQALSAPVVRATRSYGGYAPSATFRLTLADGGRAFIKATFPLPEGSAVRWSLDREEVVYRRLGNVIQPWAPDYIGSVHADGWHAPARGAGAGVAGGSAVVDRMPRRLWHAELCRHVTA